MPTILPISLSSLRVASNFLSTKLDDIDINSVHPTLPLLTPYPRYYPSSRIGGTYSTTLLRAWSSVAGAYLTFYIGIFPLAAHRPPLRLLAV